MSTITYNWGNDYLLIELGSRLNTRIQVLYWAEFLLTLGMATIFLLKPVSAKQDINTLVALGASVLYLLAAYRFFSRMFMAEKLFLDKENLVIITITPFLKKVRNYQWQYIGPLHYLGKTPKTDHPLKGNSFDYFGFDTHEHLIQSLHHEGNILFTYQGQPVRFGKYVYSWDAEEMIQMMKIYSGAKLKLGPEWQEMVT